MQPNLEHKSFPFTVKEFDAETGVAIFVASVFHNVDHSKDRVLPGFFTKSIADSKASGRMPKFVADHKWEVTHRLGKVLDLAETEEGLEVQVKFNLAKQLAREVHSDFVFAPEDQEFSFGYAVDVDGFVPNEHGGRDLKSGRLYEVSTVLIGDNPKTRLIGAKSMTVTISSDGANSQPVTLVFPTDPELVQAPPEEKETPGAAEEKAEESLDQKRERVYYAWREYAPKGDDGYPASYVMEVFDDSVIVCEGDGGYLRVPYSDSGESVTFDASGAEKVVREWLVEKGVDPDVLDMKAISGEDRSVISAEIKDLSDKDLVATHRRLHNWAAQGNVLTGFSKSDMVWMHNQAEAELRRRAKEAGKESTADSPLSFGKASAEEAASEADVFTGLFEVEFSETELADEEKHLPKRVAVIRDRYTRKPKKGAALSLVLDLAIAEAEALCRT